MAKKYQVTTVEAFMTEAARHPVFRIGSASSLSLRFSAITPARVKGPVGR